MRAELGQSRDPVRLIPGDLAGLHRTIALWRSRAADAEESGAALRQLRAVPEWAGEAADAYERRVTAAASPWDAMASAFRAGLLALEEYAAALEAARARAGDAVDLWDLAEAMDAAPAPATPGFPAADRQPLRSLEPRAEARAILDDARRALDRAAQTAATALRRALALPGLQAEEWLALLADTASASQILDALAGADGPSLRAVLRAKPALADVLAQAEPAAVAPWWAALSAAQQNALISAAPAVIGNLGGVAYAARDRANRLWLDAQLEEARAALADALKTEAPSYGSRVNAVIGAANSAQRLEAARTRVEGLENIASTLAETAMGFPRQLVSLTSDAPPLASISLGDLDAAENITFTVPGMGTTTEHINDWVRVTQNLVTMQDQLDPARSHATVAWVGYQTPPVPTGAGELDVLGSNLARQGGEKLAAEIRGLECSRPGADINVVAHSYGTTTASFALAQNDVHVQAFVTLGSAGLPAEIGEAADLQAQEVYAGQAQDVLAIDPAGGDPWAWLGRTSPTHPVNPIAPGFGAHAFSVAGGGELLPVAHHEISTPQGTGYLDPRTESLRNVAAATAGLPQMVTDYVSPAPTPFQQALIEGMAHGG
ncbi:alpha/beta hydrolase [Microbacterium sp. KSW2-29]|uniref:Alpha/beta hydrolase n=1 Tax=Microbacterium phycohabitans TaxID=3075993 RepID=A0ABU3SR05_9MICO|nr:alpha/beta hydrolase [Microbacterium sp. KSW2-29]MDU0347148.1 alpha/beta hydrolase [Microbacterium sp. KSW2-29]